MLSWASEKVSALAEAVAPPPTDTKHRFSTSLTQGNEQGALSCLTDHTDPLSPHTVLDVRRGTQPIHAAAGASSITVLRALVTQYGCQAELFDYGGNTPLHYAASTSLRSNPAQAKQCVQSLIQEFGANPTVKNSQGQTPYDVATMDSIRQYLLPIQLQRETQEAIDRGGFELPPGIDMGGMTLSKAHLAPPPVMPMPGAAGAGAGGAGGGSGAVGGGDNQFRNAGAPAYAAPPTPGQPTHAADALMSPPPVGFASTQQQQPGAAAAVPMSPAVPASPAPPAPAATQPFSPPAAPANIASGAPPAFATPQPPTPVNAAASPAPTPAMGAAAAATQSSAPTSNGAASASAASSSSGYARSGFSSAAVLPKQSKYRPDGFHSSSSDVTLQQKYGHTYSGAPGRDPSLMASVAPPPTSSGGGPNPFASGGGAAAGGASRYPTYCAITGAVGNVGGPASGGVPVAAAAATPMPTFNPYGFGATPNGSTPSPAAPAPVAPASTPSPAAAASTAMTTPQPSPASTPAAATSALPEGWAEYGDQTTGKSYYYNASTGTTSWERPQAVAADTSAPVAAEAAPVSNSESSTPAASAVERLKEGWVEVSDPASGKPYYYNAATQETSWDKPVEQVPVAEEPKQQESEPAVLVVEPAAVKPDAEPVKEESPTTAEEAIVDDIPVEELVSETEEEPETEPMADATPEVEETKPPVEAEAEVGFTAEAAPEDEPCEEDTTEPPITEEVHAVTEETSPKEETAIESEQDMPADEPATPSSADDNSKTKDVALQDDTSGASASAPVSSEDPSSDVAPAEEAPLPDGWAEAEDPTGKVYYYNSSSGATSWERPAADKVEAEVSADDNAAEASTEESSALPEGWAEATDPSGKVYYYNSATGETAWERPAGGKEEATPKADVPATPQNGTTNGTASTTSAADIFSSPPSGGAPPIMPSVGDEFDSSAAAAPIGFGGLPPPPMMSLGD